jgi:hypothetical protein
MSLRGTRSIGILCWWLPVGEDNTEISLSGKSPWFFFWPPIFQPNDRSFVERDVDLRCEITNQFPTLCKELIVFW